jgi:putative nucleotidyltransferase with HDIG domain
VLICQTLFNATENVHVCGARGHSIDIDNVRGASEEFLQASRGNFMDIMQLVHYPDYDSYTVGHSVRVAMILVLVGHRLGMDKDFLIELGTAGLLHDVGKSKIPSEILFKEGALVQEERQIIERHPVLGAQILLSHRGISKLALTAAWGHHLRPDGRGYPVPTTWGVTDKVTALLHVCDVFEALTAVRPYKGSLTPRRAYEIMLKDQGGFDQRAFSTFLSAMGLYPPGSRVQLSNGRQGIVVSTGGDIEKPIVRFTHDSSGEALSPTDSRILDLGTPEAEGLSVVKFLVGSVN